MERAGLKERVLRAFRASLSKSPCGVSSRSLPDVVREPAFVSFVPRQTSEREEIKREKPSLFWFREMDEELQREEEKIATRRKKKDEERAKKRKRRKLLSNSYGFSTSSREDSKGDHFSSDEGGAGTLLSSLSFSSDSSEFDYYSRPLSRKRKKKMKKTPRRSQRERRHRLSLSSSCSSLSRSGCVLEEVAEVVAEMGQKGFAVEKSSSDPKEDFRCSMLEMIMEQQIFGSMEMEELLCSYLSLNPPFHHRVIVEVFSEIRDTLFGETFMSSCF